MKFIFLFIISIQLFSDTLKLKNGTVLNGKIISEDKEKILIVLDDNGNTVSYFPLTSIEKIEIGSNTVIKEVQEKKEKVKINIFGFVKSNFSYSDNAVLSYGFESHHSPTAVKRQVMARDDSPRSLITASNSRIGISADYKNKANATFLFDFIDLNQSNALIASKPRIMMALLTYTPNQFLELFGGQTFDIFSDLIPHTFNPSGLMNEAGNVGFTRQQLGFKIKYNIIKFSSAAGMPNINFDSASPSLNSDLNSSPTIASNLTIDITQNSKLHLSAIYAEVKVRQPLIDENRDNLFLKYDLQDPNSLNKFNSTFPQSYIINGDGTSRVKSNGYSIGFSGELFKGFSLRSEVNYGNNLNSISASGLSRIQATNFKNIIQNSEIGLIETADPLLNSLKNYNRPIFLSSRELGGWISIEYKFLEKFTIGLHGSTAKILNQANLLSGDSRNLLKSQPNSNFWNIDDKYGAMRENSVRGYRFSYSPEEYVTFFIQHDYLITYYKNSDREKGIYNYINSYNITTNELSIRPIELPYIKTNAIAKSHIIYLGAIVPF
jgi:hypothetical protein